MVFNLALRFPERPCGRVSRRLKVLGNLGTWRACAAMHKLVHNSFSVECVIDQQRASKHAVARTRCFVVAAGSCFASAKDHIPGALFCSG